VCLSHQILANTLGMTLAPLTRPHQGLQLSVDIFGRRASIGFYNTFTVRTEPGTTRVGRTEIAADPASGDVYAMRGPGYASVQGHLESILSRDGIETLERLIAQAFAPVDA
jgi:phenazine biosynthesis protein phzE